VVRANLAALDRGGGRSLNIGTGIETSVNTIFRTIRDLAGSSQEEIHGPAMPGEQQRSCLENRLALEELEWYPETFLEEGLARTLSFFREKMRTSDTW
ncbi:MAG: UDP-glucose 4-epimerase, partial [Candidatus Deferrimicrobiaceae bacterium]